ncbi:MAG: LysM peptidoglycan-binding domain-containing protein [Planctomycetota bacterium]|jgi:nucleoid-associated protein YgaU
MKKDAKIGLAIILGAVLLSALLIGKALQRREKRTLEIPDAIEQVDETATPAESSEAPAGEEDVAAGDSTDEEPSALDLLLAGGGGGEIPAEVPEEEAQDSAAPEAGQGSMADGGTVPGTAGPAVGGSSAFGLAGNVAGETGGDAEGTDSPESVSPGEAGEDLPAEEPTDDPGTAEAAGDADEVDETARPEPDPEPAVSEGRGVSETAPAAGSAFAYTVQDGDSAWKLSKRFYGSGIHWPRIKKANPGVNFNNLKVGTRLTIPERPGSGTDAGDEAPPAAESAPAAESVGGHRIHTVASGESLYVIARDRLGSGMRYREIEKLNPGVDPRALKVGQKLKIPAR